MRPAGGRTGRRAAPAPLRKESIPKEGRQVACLTSLWSSLRLGGQPCLSRAGRNGTGRFLRGLKPLLVLVTGPFLLPSSCLALRLREERAGWRWCGRTDVTQGAAMTLEGGDGAGRPCWLRARECSGVGDPAAGRARGPRPGGAGGRAASPGPAGRTRAHPRPARAAGARPAGMPTWAAWATLPGFWGRAGMGCPSPALGGTSGPAPPRPGRDFLFFLGKGPPEPRARGLAGCLRPGPR